MHRRYRYSQYVAHASLGGDTGGAQKVGGIARDVADAPGRAFYLLGMHIIMADYTRLNPGRLTRR